MPVTKANSSKRILVIDDEPSMLKMLQLGLSQFYSVTVALSGLEGLREFSQQPFDLVISDRTMPEMDGDQLAAAVKAAAPETPIILISGLGGQSVDCTRFAAFLRKPFTMTELVSTVDDLLSTEQADRTKAA